MPDGAMSVPFERLREVPEIPGFRQVGIHIMDREQYETEEWRITGTWRVEHPHRLGCEQRSRNAAYWEPSLSGLRRYAEMVQRRREERRLAYRTRQEKDEEWTRHVESLIEERDGG